MKKILIILFSAVAMFAVAGNNGPANTATDEVRVGIAWRSNAASRSYASVIRAVEDAGGVPIVLEQVRMPEWQYDDEGDIASRYLCEEGHLKEKYAQVLKSGSAAGVARGVAAGVDVVIFTGGEDVSPTLYAVPQPWHGIEEERDYNPTRDISDYMLMDYCVRNDIPTLGICRGMQLLAIYSGADFIQDIPAYFARKGVDYDNSHRALKPQGGRRPQLLHDVAVSEGSILRDIVDSAVVAAMPTVHHQAVGGVENTPLRVTGTTATCGEEFIEVVERTDKSCIMGVQFHPEITVARYLDGKGFSEREYRVARRFFTYFVERVRAGKQASATTSCPPNPAAAQ